MSIDYEYEIEKSCYQCECQFMVLSEREDVVYCPFCGEALEEEHEEDIEDSDD